MHLGAKDVAIRARTQSVHGVDIGTAGTEGSEGAAAAAAVDSNGAEAASERVRAIDQYLRQAEFKDWFHNCAIQQKRKEMKRTLDELAVPDTAQHSEHSTQRTALVLYVGMAGGKPNDRRQRMLPVTSLEKPGYLQEMVDEFVKEELDSDDEELDETDDRPSLHKIHTVACKNAAAAADTSAAMDLAKSPLDNLITNGDFLEIRSASWESKQAKSQADAKAKMLADRERKKEEAKKVRADVKKEREAAAAEKSARRAENSAMHLQNQEDNKRVLDAELVGGPKSKRQVHQSSDSGEEDSAGCAVDQKASDSKAGGCASPRMFPVHFPVHSSGLCCLPTSRKRRHFLFVISSRVLAFSLVPCVVHCPVHCAGG